MEHRPVVSVGDLQLLLPVSSKSVSNIFLIRKPVIHPSGSQVDQELPQAVHQDVHQLPAFIGRGRFGVAQARILADQVPGPRDGDPTAIDGI
jgi:hypothetical protein